MCAFDRLQADDDVSRQVLDQSNGLVGTEAGKTDVKAASRAYHSAAGWSSGAALMKKRPPDDVVTTAAKPEVKPVPVTWASTTCEPRREARAERNKAGRADQAGRSEVRS
jgi:hypothetical protein